MSRKLKILVIVVAVAAMLGIVGGVVYAASGGDTGLSSIWHGACGQGDGDGNNCCDRDGDGGQLQSGSCH